MVERFVDVQYGEGSYQVSQGAFGQEDEDLHGGLEVKASENCPSELQSNFDCFESCAATIPSSLRDNHLQIFQQNNKVNVSNMSSAPSLPSAPRASMMASMPYEWLWCDNHVKITEWALAQPKLPYKQFYGSYLNHVNQLWERSRQKDHPALEGLNKSAVELLQKERMPADELLESLKEYWRSLGEGKSRWKGNGLVVVNSQLSRL